ncbi:MAG: Serine-rich repeat adhesion glycoprotein, partial [Acidimicrobiaceae bacterium]
VNYRNSTASGAAARLTSSTLRFYAGGTTDVTSQYTQRLLTTLPVVVPAGQTRSVDFTFSATSTATLGPIAVTVSSTAVDHNDLTPLTVAAPASRYTSMSESRPVLRIAGPNNQRPGVFPQRSPISTGQLVPFRLEVRNFGGSSARVGAAPSLNFFAGVVDKTSEYTCALTSGAGIFVPAASGGNTTGVTLTFDVTPSSSATALGMIQVGATVPATGTVNGVTGSDVSTGVIPPVSAGSFLLQSRVAVAAADVFFDPAIPRGVDRSSTTSAEQLLLSRVSVQVRISNNNGLNGATMNVSNVSLRLTTSSPTTLINSEYEIAPATFTPFTISGNASRVVTFTLSAKPTAQK